MPLDAERAVATLGGEIGNLPAYVIVALVLAVAVLGWALWKTMNARIADGKEHTIQILENSRSLDKAIDMVRDRSRDV